MIMLHSLNVLDQIGSSTSSAMHQAFTLTWGIEMLHSYDLLEDIKHREHIGNKSNTDTDYANLLRSFLYAMLEDNCSNNFVQLFNKGFLFISLGKYIANDISSKGKIEKYSNFNMNTYELLCEYKTAFNTYKLPLIIASQLSRQSKIHNHIDKIGTDLGKLYQIKNEYEDCFGGESKTYRSAGVNIQQGKCTWLAVTALQRCTAAQRIVFNTCYGSNEPAHVERIKSLYERLNIPQLYRETEGALNESIMQRAETAGVPLELFSSLLETLNVE
ncbi:unnamed protein product [Diatraea saccharalis]|uniref:Farnesyl diphosphate synthase n=1 Tax=Diatraea saccharalis TaxID=40085 RepID=A0A9N9RDQ4_9NEOP|nr:unnamed protein product [Diatraea saccharalis]